MSPTAPYLVVDTDLSALLIVLLLFDYCTNCRGLRRVCSVMDEESHGLESCGRRRQLAKSDPSTLRRPGFVPFLRHDLVQHFVQDTALRNLRATVGPPHDAVRGKATRDGGTPCWLLEGRVCACCCKEPRMPAVTDHHVLL